MKRFAVSGLIAVASVVFVCRPASGQPPAESVTPDWQEFTASLKGVFERGGDVGEMLTRLNGRCKRLDPPEKQAAATALKSAFVAALAPAASQERQLFSEDNAARRSGLLGVLKATGSGFNDADVAGFLPRADAPEKSSLAALLSPAFAELAAAHWGDACDKRVLELLSAPAVVEKPEHLLGVAWLGLKVGPAAGREKIEAAVRAAYFGRKDPLPEAQLAGLYRQFSDARWQAKDMTTFRDRSLGALADELQRQPSVEDLPEADRLTDAEYLALARRRPAWTDWSEKLVRQLKPPKGRNPRARRLLTAVVADAGDHFAVLEKLTAPDRDAGYFVYLHSSHADDPAGPWQVLTRDSKAAARAGALLRDLFSPKAQDAWPVGLLDLLEREYYPRDADGLFKDVLVPVAGDAPEDNAVRRALLKRVSDGRFPPEADRRWALGWGAAKGKALKAEVRVGEERPAALAFLAAVCRGAEPGKDDRDPLRQVNDTYGELLTHTHARLFMTEPPDAALDDALILRELGDVFRRLAALRTTFGWKRGELTSVAAYWDQVEKSLQKAVVAKDRVRTAHILRMMFSLAAVGGDPDHVRHLAAVACAKVFGVSAATPFRVWGGSDMDEQAALFTELEPAIRAAIEGVRKDPAAGGQAFGDEIVELFDDQLYRPLLRTERFLSHAAGGKPDPWLWLAGARSEPAARTAARARILDDLKTAPFLNAPDAVRHLVRECLRAEGTSVWLAPDAVPLGGNVTLPLFKTLLDESKDDLHGAKAAPGKVFGLFVTHLNNDRLWVTECAYGAAGKPAKESTLDRAPLLPYLSGLLGYVEALAAPFRGATEFDVAAAHKYTPESGPVFELPAGEWERTGLSGALRLRYHEAAATLLGKSPAFDRQMVLANVALLLPNRAAHAAPAADLAKYRGVKESAAASLEAHLPALGGRDLLRALMLLAQFRYSYAADKVPAASAAVRAAAARLKAAPGGMKMLRELRYSEIHLRMYNLRGAGATPRDHVREILDNLYEELDLPRDEGGPEVLITLNRHAAFAREYMAQVGPDDVLALLPLIEAIPQCDPRTAADVLWAFGLLLPFYALDQTALLGEGEAAQRNLHALILFSQLTLAAKRHLAELVNAPAQDPAAQLGTASRPWVGQLIAAHNNLAVVAAGRVFEDQALLLAAHKMRKYSIETTDFSIVYHRRVEKELSAAELMKGAVGGVSLNFELAQKQFGFDRNDQAVVEFLFLGKKWGDTSSVALDSVLQTCARIATDPRYDGDAELAAAAAAFRKGANDFFDTNKPPELVWFDRDGAAFESAATYLAACERGGEAIANGKWPPWVLPNHPPEALAKWEREARLKHSKLWHRLLLGDGRPPWREKFVRAFAAFPKPEEDARRAALMAGQRAAAGEFVRGGGAAGPLQLRGLQHSLHERDRLHRLDPDGAAAKFWDAYWTAAKSAIQAAVVGEGMPAEAVFPARPFVTAGAPAALTLAELKKTLDKDTGAALFDALDWPTVWDDLHADRRLKALLGEPLTECQKRAAPGLGGTSAKPDSYRKAVWLAASAGAVKDLTPAMTNLGAANTKLDAATLADRSAAAEKLSQGVYRDVASVIAYRVESNTTVTALASRSLAAAGEVGGRANRNAGWDWLRVDATTVGWAKAQVAPAPWASVAPVWAPFGTYAFLDKGSGFPEPAAMGLTDDPKTWPGADRHDFALLYLCRLTEVTKTGDVRLSAECVAAFDAARREEPAKSLSRSANPTVCRDQVREWAELRWWAEALNGGQRAAVVKMPNYSFEGLAEPVAARFRGADVGPLGAAGRDRCTWTEQNPTAWCDRYRRKLAFVEACAAAVPARAPEGDWVSAADALAEFVARTSPYASPYEPVPVGGGVRLVTARAGFRPAELLAAPEESRRSRLEHLRRCCLIQQAVGPEGKVELLPAGYLGFVDLLHPPKK